MGKIGQREDFVIPDDISAGCFETKNLAGNSGLRNTESIGCAGKITRICHGDKKRRLWTSTES
jgi:hypothetical protein